MKAQEAREIADKNPHGTVIQPYLEHLYAKIKDNAEAGKMSLVHPLSVTPHRPSTLPYPTIEQQDAIWKALVIEGYKVKHHANADHGHPAGGDYTEISW